MLVSSRARVITYAYAMRTKRNGTKRAHVSRVSGDAAFTLGYWVDIYSILLWIRDPSPKLENTRFNQFHRRPLKSLARTPILALPDQPNFSPRNDAHLSLETFPRKWSRNVTRFEFDTFFK